MNTKYDQRNELRDANSDPLTGAPGSHPVGVGVGGMAGGAAAGALAGTMFGPIGTLVGAAAGVIAGAAIGKGVAERIDPTGEAEYWREEHRNRPYYKDDYDYDRDYASAYGLGLTAREADLTRDWGEAEDSLRRDWDSAARGDSRLAWDEAREAVRDAWDRTDRTYRTYQRSDTHWSEAFDNADYRDDDAEFEDYRYAYRYGTQARAHHADRAWDDTLESELARDWNHRRGHSKLSWDRARPAVRDAYTSSSDGYSGSQGSYLGNDRSQDRFRVS